MSARAISDFPSDVSLSYNDEKFEINCSSNVTLSGVQGAKNLAVTQS
jgi:hypothetical protein